MPLTKTQQDAFIEGVALVVIWRDAILPQDINDVGQYCEHQTLLARKRLCVEELARQENIR